MTIKEEHQIKVNFPLSKYLQQLFSSDVYVRFINPFSFWRRYRIERLETCWEIDTVKNLERCRQVKWQPGRSRHHQTSIKTEIGSYRGVPWEKTPQNTILISQSSMKLKYRGVTYLSSNIVAINANKVKTKPDLNTTKPPEANFSGNIDLTMPPIHPHEKRE